MQCWTLAKQRQVSINLYPDLYVPFCKTVSTLSDTFEERATAASLVARYVHHLSLSGATPTAKAQRRQHTSVNIWFNQSGRITLEQIDQLGQELFSGFASVQLFKTKIGEYSHLISKLPEQNSELSGCFFGSHMMVMVVERVWGRRRRTSYGTFWARQPSYGGAKALLYGKQPNPLNFAAASTLARTKASFYGSMDLISVSLHTPKIAH